DTAYLVLERLEGETNPRHLLRDERYVSARAGLAGELGRILARIHAIDATSIPGLEHLDALPWLWARYAELGEPRPAVELGLRWLADHRPPRRGDTVVHGDFRTGNLLIDPSGLRGVLDWELVHRGDPMADLGWLCTKAWRFGSPLPVGGFGERAELLAGYTEAGGTAPSAETLRWWECYGTVRWAVLCRHQAQRHLSGAEPSVELAVLGRKVCEQEHDILLALGHTAPADADTDTDTDTDTDEAPLGQDGRSIPPHDRPDAAALLDSVRAFLRAVSAESEPVLRFRAAVAANAVSIAQREALLAPAHARVHRARLAALGCADDTQLAMAIRDGTLDARFDEVCHAVCDAVTDKLLVANPAHLSLPA
ncbi:MAG: phosphotransferase family protein, partial [Sciscionella sp.]